MRAKHDGRHVDIVLVPAPSNDPDDPLNWSRRRKALASACMCMYTIMVGIASAAIYSVFEPISDATGLSLGDLDAGTGYMVEARLLMGSRTPDKLIIIHSSYCLVGVVFSGSLWLFSTGSGRCTSFRCWQHW